MDDGLSEEKEEESDGDELLTDEEMAAFRARMIAKKGKNVLSNSGQKPLSKCFRLCMPSATT